MMYWDPTPLIIVIVLVSLLPVVIFFGCIIWINHKLWDIRDSFEELINKIEEKEKNSWN